MPGQKIANGSSKDVAIGDEIDVARIVLLPARFAVQVIRDAAAAGARSATIVTSGFSELEDAENKQLAVELKEAARETGLAAPGR